MTPEARSGGVRAGRQLATCHGYRVVALDGFVGEVDTPIFPPDLAEPDYLVVRVRGGVRVRRPIVAAAVVEEIDPGRRIVYVRGRRDEIARLPEHLPLAL